MENKIFKLKNSNNILEVIISDGQNKSEMIELKAKSEDATLEKHVPYIEEKEDGYLVKVGKEINHPMSEEHYIQFIEIIIDDKILHRCMLSPTSKPEVYFRVEKGSKVVAREYCNLHGLWKNKL